MKNKNIEIKNEKPFKVRWREAKDYATPCDANDVCETDKTRNDACRSFQSTAIKTEILIILALYRDMDHNSS